MNPGADPEDMIAIRVWFNRNMIVTAGRRERRLLSVDDVRTLIHQGRGPKTTGDFVVSLLEHSAARIGDVVDNIDENLLDLQNRTDRIMHYVEDLDLARERTLMLQGDLQNRLAEQ